MPVDRSPHHTAGIVSSEVGERDALKELSETPRQAAALRQMLALVVEFCLNRKGLRVSVS